MRIALDAMGGDRGPELLVEGALLALRENKSIEVFENCFAIDLIIKNKECIGANILDIKKREIYDIFARVTVLATGGVGYIYLNTTNPEIAHR